MRQGVAMRVVGYVRVSTSKQAEEGFGLAVQERDIRDFAKGARIRLVGLARDEGVSGGIEDRPGLAEALALLEERRAEGLLVARLDRLARKLTVQEAILAQVWRHGGTVFAADTGEVAQDDPDDPMRTAMRQMMGVFSQLERAMISARLRAGRRTKADQGGYAYGAPPFGTRSEDGRLVKDAREAEAVALVHQLHAEGFSFRGICTKLAESGYAPRRSQEWHPMTVARIMKRAGASSTS
jgi:DNA invertase Pin-like site-specific DNA recombinase